MGLPRESTFLLFGLGVHERSWRGLCLVALLFFGSLLFAAVVSPLVYWGFAVWNESAPNELNRYLAEKGFPRYFDRLRWLPVVLFLPWLIRRCGLWSWVTLGFRLERGLWRELLRWAGVGSTLLFIVVLGQILAGSLILRANFSGSEILGIIITALLSGIIVGFLEEVVFRGVIFRTFYCVCSPLIAAFISSLFFACVHFKKIPEQVWAPDSDVTLGSGFYVGFWTLISITQTFDPLHFVGLFFVGLVLTLLFMRTRSLWSCVGMHAGWVSLLAVVRRLYRPGGTDSKFWWGSERIIDGGMATLLLLSMSLWLYYSLKGNEEPGKQ